MSKERLKEIKDQYDWTVINGLQPRIDDSELEWLIEQAKRVQELEKQNKRYREAIERAIDKLTWNSVESEEILRKALEGKQ